MKASEVLERHEIKALMATSDLRGAISVLTDWALIAGAMALVAHWTHPLTIALALVVIGVRQLGLSVLMHECSHRSLFRRRWLNDWVGTWLVGGPVWSDVVRYREHHRRHHTQTGTERDPDLGLVRPFPTSRASLVRKLLRDLLGWTGLRRILGLLAMDFGFISYTASTDAVRAPSVPLLRRLRLGAGHLGPVVVTNAALLGVLASLGHAELYLLWVGAWMTTFSVVLRVRSIAEHACTALDPDPLLNTRTVRPSWLVQVMFAPHHVNYHLEHHLLMTVPHYRLPQMHRLLEERGVFTEENYASGYLAVLRRVTETS